MKVCLVTKTGKNYGAVLQAVALKKIIETHGILVELLNYPSKAESNTFKVFRMINNIRDLRYDYYALRHPLGIYKCNKKFLQFRKDEFNFSQPYNDAQEIFLNPPEHDVAIAGSDQIWNPYIQYSPAYFLAFSTKKKFSYASSLGINFIPEEYRSKFVDYLSGFDSVSVREESAKKALKSIGIESEVHCDPTLLVTREEWTKLCVKMNLPEHYILVYTLYNDKLLYDTAMEAKRILGYDIVYLGIDPCLETFGDFQIWSAGPKEFLTLILNSDFIVTSSYHGMLFSLNFGRRFVAVPPFETKDRFATILHRLGQEYRIICEINSVNYCMKEDFSYLDKLEIERNKGIDYITEMLKNIAE